VREEFTTNTDAAPANDTPATDAADIDWFTDAPSAVARRDDGEESGTRNWPHAPHLGNT
jgi:hypothetical protein